MPTYDYLCADCGHCFEEFQSMTAKPLRTCPVCKQPKLDRLIGAGAGVIFKGSGFYQTDYKRSDATNGKNGRADGGCSPKCGTDDAPAGCRMKNKPE
jgi:putative FmdB family regulatory protein